MKKIITLVLILTAIAGILSGCADPEAKAVKKFTNRQMKDIYQSFDEIKTESDKWRGLSSDKKVIANIEDEQIPALEKIVKRVSEIKTETKNVKNLKRKYIKAVELHIEGYTAIAKGLDNFEEKDILRGMDLVDEGEKLMEEYYSDIEKLAKKYDIKIKENK